MIWSDQIQSSWSFVLSSIWRKRNKDLPSVGTITVQDPFTGERRPYELPRGGLGFTRVPSLISVWSTAPLLLNNQLGTFDANPSVESRMASFQESIERLLWPEKRRQDPGFDGFIMRTTERSMVLIPKRDIPGQLSSLFRDLPDRFSDKLKDPISRIFDKYGNFEFGPIPKGFPLTPMKYIISPAKLPYSCFTTLPGIITRYTRNTLLYGDKSMG